MDLMQYSIDQSLPILREGGLILYPTDTVWGIGCDATNSRAVERIYRLKQREDAKSMIILVATQKDILTYTAQAPAAIFDFLEKADRPTTVIYDQALGLADHLMNADRSIAIRVVGEPFCKTIIQRLGRAIVSTSANLSGQPTPKIFSEIAQEILEGVDYVVDYRRDDETPRMPSRIVRILADGEIKIIRE